MSIRIVIADDEAITRMDLKERLESKGYAVVGQAADGFDAIEICKEVNPDIILMDVKMPILDGLSAAKVINEEKLAGCIVMLTAYSDIKFIETATQRGVMGYVVKPIEDKSLIPAIEIAVNRSKEMYELVKAIEEKDKKIDERKVIEKAKGLLMAKNKINESEAYEYIRSVSMSKRVPMKRVADSIILGYEFIVD